MLGKLTADNPYSIARCVEAVSNLKALLLIAAGAFAAGVLYAAGAYGGPWLLGLACVAGPVAAAAGVSAAGVCLLDQGRRKVLRSLPVYAAAGLAALPRLLALVFLIALAYAAVLGAAAVLLFLCKIPGLGALLLAVLIPTLVAVLAVVTAAAYIMLVLAAPAVWDGHGVLTAFAAAFRIARQRPSAVLIKLALGLILSWLVALCFMGFVLIASLEVGGLSAGILGLDAGIGEIALGFAEGSLRMLAGAFGYVIVFAMVSALVSMMPVMVAVLTWLEFSAGLDLHAAAAAGDGAMAAVRRRFSAPPAESSRGAPAPTDSPAVSAAGAQPAPEAAPATRVCPECGARVSGNDLFCGVCGQKIGA